MWTWKAWWIDEKGLNEMLQELANLGWEVVNVLPAAGSVSYYVIISKKKKT